MVACALLAALVAAASPAAPEAPASAGEAAAWATGLFDTRDQAALDPEVRPVRLVTVAVPKSRLSFGAPVLYWEEAFSDRLDRPEVQRFLRFEEDATGKLLARLFALKERLVAAGKWSNPSDLALFGKNDVREQTDCVVFLTKTDGRYEGKTGGRSCGAAAGTAVTASLELRIWPDRMEVWDRGFDAEGRQVFGPLKGPYRFVKKSAAPPGE